MKIALISANGQEYEIGLRTIASALGSDGHDVSVVYPLARAHRGMPRLDPAGAASLRPLCADADLIGVSYLSNFRGNARMIASALRPVMKRGALLVAGGIHATICPEDALRDFPYVVRGEAEEAMRELADRLSRARRFEDIRNLAYLREDRPVLNPLRPLAADLDALPAPFLEYGRTYFRDASGRLSPLDEDNVRQFFWQNEAPRNGEIQYYYPIHSARGCPHKCSFCVNEALSCVYAEHSAQRPRLRQQSPARIVAELQWARNAFPFFQTVLFTDDVFTARPVKELTEFAALYKARIALPFECYVSAPSVTDEKMDVLVDAGLKVVSLGIQSGSDRMNREVFHRPISRKQNQRAVATVASRFPRMDPEMPMKVHFIVKCPWEKRRDLVETVRFIARLPSKVFVILFGLNYFPGTKVFEWAKAQGIVRDLESDVENADGWSETHFIFDRKTGRPSPYAIVPLLAVQHIRFVPRWQRALLIALLTNPLVFRLLGTWRFSSRIRKAVEAICKASLKKRAARA
jgi:radical SAM superfamily enzyme YgiQ (UPF0313 family)